MAIQSLARDPTARNTCRLNSTNLLNTDEYPEFHSEKFHEINYFTVQENIIWEK